MKRQPEHKEPAAADARESSVTLRRFIERMPSLSTTVTKVLEVCNQPNASANDLNRVISLDPVLTGQVLKLINSAYYSMPNQIGSLPRAIIMLGINTVKNLALSTAVLGTLGRENAFHSLDMDQFWTHSLGVGATARILAARCGVARQQQEEFFVAGLLHDLGKIPLNACFAPEYSQAMDLAGQRQRPLDWAETQVLALDHCQVGQMIGKKWQLNANLVELLAGHHRPGELTGEVGQLARLISLADAYVNLQGLGSAGNRYPDRATFKKLLAAEKLDWPTMVKLTPAVEQEIEKARVFLAVAAAEPREET